jgi:hypothetical protein
MRGRVFLRLKAQIGVWIMNRIRRYFSVYLAIGLLALGMTAGAQAQNRRNEREVRDIVRSLNSKVDDFQYSLNYRLRSTSGSRDDIDRVGRDLKNLHDKINLFENNLDLRRENAQDVNDIVDAARYIDDFLRNSAQTRKLETDWTGIRDLIGRLGSNYGVTPGWNEGGQQQQYPSNSNPTSNYPQQEAPVISVGLTGTYQLDAARSDNPADVVADAGVTSSDQRQDLSDKLLAPDQIAVEVRGNQVTLATSNAAPTTFIADGREKTETQPGGGVSRIRATIRGQVLTVTSLGSDTDYTITFTSGDNGRTMKVQRRVTTDYVRQTVFAESTYNKTDSVARLGIDNGQNSPDSGAYSSNDPADNGNSNTGNYPTANSGRRGEYVVRNGEIITGFLENEINTKVSQNNDRFKITVQTPDQYRGAVIEGYITGIGRSGKVTGRSNVTFNFERITLRNGQTYDFAGFLQNVKDASGKDVAVDTEGAAKGKSQTRESAKRGGIGAGIGAVIGAIAGGVKGAAIGAIIGGGAGAGSVAIENKGDLVLGKGSTITIQASSPKQ